MPDPRALKARAEIEGGIYVIIHGNNPQRILAFHEDYSGVFPDLLVCDTPHHSLDLALSALSVSGTIDI